MFRIILLASLLTTLLATQGLAEGEARYNAQTGALHIPKVKVEGDVSGAAYRVDMVNKGAWNFGISGISDAPEAALSHIAIFGDSTVRRNGTLQLTALAIANDGTWTDITSSAIWSSSSFAVSSVENGRVRASYVSYDQLATVRASYTIGDTPQSGIHTITVSVDPTSRLYLEMINADSAATGSDPLFKQPNDGFIIRLGDTVYDISSSEIQKATTYPEFIVAVEEKLASLELSESIEVTLGEVFTYAHPATFEPVSGTTIVLSYTSDETMRPVAFSNVSFDPTVTFLSRIY